MTEDDDPNTSGDQGLSIGVIRAWEYVKYKGYPPSVPYTPIILAVIDSGFDLDETTGVPLNGNLDYPGEPLQIDEIEEDLTAGGPASGSPTATARPLTQGAGTGRSVSASRLGSHATTSGQLAPAEDGR